MPFDLIDTTMPVVPKDHADDDVRKAFQSVKEKERIESAADQYGHDGIHQMEAWNSEIKRVGPDAAKSAGLYYATNPRSAPAEVEEERTEDEITAAARKAYKQESKKQTAEQKAAAIDGVRRLSIEHGGVGIIDTFAGWHQQLQQNPYDAAPRIQREIAERVNTSVLQNRAVQAVAEWDKRSKNVTPEQRQLMSELLMSRRAADLAESERASRYLLALDVEDPWKREVTASQRQAEEAQMHVARQTVDAWKRAHPDIAGDQKRMNRMRRLLEKEQVRTLDEAAEATA
jgi:hypothetical protein